MSMSEEEAIELLEEMKNNCLTKRKYKDEKAEKKAEAIETLIEALQKKDKIIDLMADKLVEAHEWFYSEFDNYTKKDFKQYFEKKIEEG